MLDDSEFIKLEGIDEKEMSLRLSLLDTRNSRKISDNSIAETSLQKSIHETVERNPCKRIGLHQVRKTKLSVNRKKDCYLTSNEIFYCEKGFFTLFFKERMDTEEQLTVSTTSLRCHESIFSPVLESLISHNQK